MKKLLAIFLTLKYAPDCCKTQGMCNIAVNTNSSTLMHVPYCYKTQKKCEKVYTCLFMLDFVPDCYKTQKTCEK